PRPRPRVLRRHLALDRPRDRVAMDPGQLVDRPLRTLLHEVQPSDLGPLLHADHTPPPRPITLDQARLRDQPDTTDSAPGGPLFNRRRRSSIQVMTLRA